MNFIDQSLSDISQQLLKKSIFTSIASYKPRKSLRMQLLVQQVHIVTQIAFTQRNKQTLKKRNKNQIVS